MSSVTLDAFNAYKKDIANYRTKKFKYLGCYFCIYKKMELGAEREYSYINNARPPAIDAKYSIRLRAIKRKYSFIIPVKLKVGKQLMSWEYWHKVFLKSILKISIEVDQSYKRLCTEYELNILNLPDNRLNSYFTILENLFREEMKYMGKSNYDMFPQNLLIHIDFAAHHSIFSFKSNLLTHTKAINGFQDPDADKLLSNVKQKLADTPPAQKKPTCRQYALYYYFLWQSGEIEVWAKHEGRKTWLGDKATLHALSKKNFVDFFSDITANKKDCLTKTTAPNISDLKITCTLLKEYPKALKAATAALKKAKDE